MKIGIDCHHLEDQLGIRRYTMVLLQEWERLGFLADNQVLCYVRGQSDYTEAFPKGVEVVSLNSRSTLLFQHVRLAYEAYRDSLDVLFSPSYMLPLVYRGKTVVTIHDIIYEAAPNEFDWHSRFDRLYLPKASYYSAKKATFILVPSEFTKREIQTTWRIESSKIFVTHLAGDINTAKMKPITPRGDFILYIGSIFNRRHVPQLISAFFKIVKKQPTLRLILVGKDRTLPPQHIDTLIAEVNYKMGREAIVRKDWVTDEELTRLFYSARALALLSSYEGFGLPVLEALSCGLPVLATKKGSLSEIAGEAALYVERPANVDEIARKLLQLVSDTALRRELKSKGLRQAQKFSWTKTANDTWDILALAAKL